MCNMRLFLATSHVALALDLSSSLTKLWSTCSPLRCTMNFRLIQKVLLGGILTLAIWQIRVLVSLRLVIQRIRFSLEKTSLWGFNASFNYELVKVSQVFEAVTSTSWTLHLLDSRLIQLTHELLWVIFSISTKFRFKFTI